MTRTELRASRGGEVVAWIERFVVHGEGDMVGQPFLLRDDQKLLLFRRHKGWGPKLSFAAAYKSTRCMPSRSMPIRRSSY